MLTPWKESYDQSRQHIQKKRRYFANIGRSSQGYGFSSGHVWMWGWTVKKAEHRRIDAFELWCWRRVLRVPWTSVRSNQSILKEINPEYSLEGLKLKVTLQYFGQPDAKNWLIGRDPDAGKDWRQEKKGSTDDEIVEWHFQLDRHECKYTRGVGDGQGSLLCYTPLGCKESDTTEEYYFHISHC